MPNSLYSPSKPISMLDLSWGFSILIKFTVSDIFFAFTSLNFVKSTHGISIEPSQPTEPLKQEDIEESINLISESK